MDKTRFAILAAWLRGRLDDSIREMLDSPGLDGLEKAEAFREVLAMVDRLADVDTLV